MEPQEFSEVFGKVPLCLGLNFLVDEVTLRNKGGLIIPIHVNLKQHSLKLSEFLSPCRDFLMAHTPFIGR